MPQHPDLVIITATSGAVDSTLKNLAEYLPQPGGRSYKSLQSPDSRPYRSHGVGLYGPLSTPSAQNPGAGIRHGYWGQ